MIEASNLSHNEFFRLNGALSQGRTEQVLQELDESESNHVREYLSYAEESRIGFASEDFLQEEMSDLRHFAKRNSGDNKLDLLSYIEAIEFKLQELRGQVEYGSEQLNKIIKAAK